MTNRDDLPPDDELASAYVDGELDASGRARVESDPTLLAEVAALREIRAAVADLPTPELDHARRDAAIKAALATADSNVVPFTRPTGHRWVGAVLGVAAAVLLVLFGAAVVRGGGQSSNSSASAPTTAAARAEAAAATTAAAGAASADASATLASPQPGGEAVAGGGAAVPSPLPPNADSSFKAAAPTDADLAALRDAGRRALPLPPPTVAAGCPAPTPGADFAGTVLWSTGVTAELFLERRLSPPTAWALAPGSCLVLATVPLA
jgi:hypothetical protein